ncbi:MAG: hypothetical protein M4579_003855 [Chaenotheca gracillima]|nr:MAG: hypothetical protein M4579_003855 [Chaenotheca gracillima]
MSFQKSRPTAVWGSQASNAFGTGSSFGATSTLSYISEPPNLSSISDPNVIVAFKNLYKKDATTKSKALEDIQAYLNTLKEGGKEVEDAILEAWIKIYPRTSIDVSRRVRQLAHSVQSQFARSSGKRIAKHMPQVVGAWLAGIYDNDRGVSRSAEEGLRSVFPSQDKLQNVWRVYQRPILEFSKEVILKETAQTLSDERVVSPDDAESKHARVVATGISLIGSLLSKLSAQEHDKVSELYDEILESEKLWAFSLHRDAFLRRNVFKLLGICLTKRKSVVSSNLRIFSTIFVSKGLHEDQVGSARDYSDTLALLTIEHPTVWTDEYTAKRSAAARLRQFVKKGSQSGPPDFWNNLSRIFANVPEAVLPQSAAEVLDFLDSLREGINSKHEIRTNLKSAWLCYIDTTIRTCLPLPEGDKSGVLGNAVMPLFQQYVKANKDTAQFNAGPDAVSICSIAFTRVLKHLDGSREILEEEWAEIAGFLVREIHTSLPEQSKDFERSQNNVGMLGRRWTSLNAKIYQEADKSLRVGDMFAAAFKAIISASLELLISRNGKPYGAANILASTLELAPDVTLSNQYILDSISNFLIDQLPILVTSPSAAILFSCNKTIGRLPGQQSFFTKSFNATVQATLAIADVQLRDETLVKLISSLDVDSSAMLSPIPELETYLQQTLDRSLQGQKDSWDLISSALSKQGHILSHSTTDKLLSDLTGSLALDDKATFALDGAKALARQDSSILKSFVHSRPELLSNLLFLAESPDDNVGSRAESVAKAIQSSLPKEKEGVMSQPVLEIIGQGLVHAGPSSLSVEALLELAHILLEGSNQSTDLVRNLIPSAEHWDAALAPFLQTVPNPSLSLTNSFGGAISLISGTKASHPNLQISRDGSGYSCALRISLFATRLFKTVNVVENTATAERELLLRNIRLTLDLGNDNLGLAGANGLWDNYSTTNEAEIVDFLSDGQELVNSILRPEENPRDEAQLELVGLVQEHLEAATAGAAPEAYYNARALASINEALCESGVQQPTTDLLTEGLRKARSKETLAFLIGYRDHLSRSKDIGRFCNELVSDLTFQDDSSGDSQSALRKRVLLNAMLQDQALMQDIPPQRLIPFVKTLLSSSIDSRFEPASRTAEAAKILSQTLPCVRDVYGEHWSLVLQFIEGSLSGTPSESHLDDQLPVIHASLRLYSVMQRIHSANDDADDAWHDAEDRLSEELLELLKGSPDISDDTHQPLRIVNSLLARQVSSIPPDLVKDPVEFYPLLQLQSYTVQQAAFEILHKKIPLLQEQVSLDAALGDSVAQIPEELFSLVLQAPAVDPTVASSWERSMPVELRGYLLSWVLIFDHFSRSSYKVRSDYIAAIKEGGYFSDLVTLIFGFLGHDRGKAVDVSSFDVTTYTCDSESPVRDAQWLMSHLYYLSLKYVPSLTKAWWIDCPRRQTRDSVETWTEKFISPLVIEDELRTVSEWVENNPEAANEDMKVKVSTKAKEVTASYEVDEQRMQIVIRLPGTYPLRQIAVEGLNRVGVDEKKWRSWLITTQGVIMFSNGSIIDGLTTWRKNVSGALKGQIECAICYSIISSDKQLPSKKCNTCKNLFHSSCLFKWFKSSNSLCKRAARAVDIGLD